MPTCSSASPKNRALLAFRINQGISASFSLLLSRPPGSGPLRDQQLTNIILHLGFHKNDYTQLQNSISRNLLRLFSLCSEAPRRTHIHKFKSPIFLHMCTGMVIYNCTCNYNEVVSNKTDRGQILSQQLGKGRMQFPCVKEIITNISRDVMICDSLFSPAFNGF